MKQSGRQAGVTVLMRRGPLTVRAAWSKPQTMDGPVGLSEIAGRYDAILCDVWGVIRDGRNLLKPALAALQAFRAEGGPVVLISNSPRRSEGLAGDLAARAGALGFGDPPWDRVVTSGESIREVIIAHAPGPAYEVGRTSDMGEAYQGTGLTFTDDLAEARVLTCASLFDGEADRPEDYRDGLTEAKLRDLSLICVNPDVVVQVGDTLYYCAGAIAQIYERLGGSVIYAGKPHPPIFDAGFRALEAAAAGAVERDRVLVIGDGPETDIAGAQREGLDALFITGGIAGRAFSQGFDITRVEAYLREKHLAARWAAPALTW